MKNPNVITPKDQAQPEPHRHLFLEGVLEEARVQGYSVKDTGRLYVAALRGWEDANR